LRKRIIETYKAGKEFAEIGELFGCHRKTVDQIVKDYLVDGRIVHKERKGEEEGSSPKSMIILLNHVLMKTAL
jgi:hypothetical protein